MVPAIESNMPRMSIGFVGLIAGLSAASFGQSPVFNFQKVNVDEGFYGYSVNNSGAILGNYYGTTEIWTQQYGLTQVTKDFGDNYLTTISDSGRVYGDNNGKVIRFDPFGGRQVIMDDPSYRFSVVNSNDRDSLLVRGYNPTTGGSKYFVYDLTGVRELNLPTSGGFTPTHVNWDGSVIGTLPGGTSPVGTPGFSVVKLNPDGTTGSIPHAQTNWVASNFSYTQSFKFLPNGTMMVADIHRSSSASAGTENTMSTVYLPDGTSYQMYAQNNSGYSYFVAGSTPTVVLNDGNTIARDVSPSFGIRKMVYNAANPNGFVMDASNFAPGSFVPDYIQTGTAEGLLLGDAMVDGHHVTYMTVSTVPEPASLAVLGLGALALLRRRKK